MFSVRQEVIFLNIFGRTAGFKVVPWLRRLVATVSTRRTVFDSGLVRVNFVVDKVAVGKVSLRVLRFSSVIIIPLMLHTHRHHHRSTAGIGRTRGRSLENFNDFLISGSTKYSSNLTLYFGL